MTIVGVVCDNALRGQRYGVGLLLPALVQHSELNIDNVQHPRYYRKTKVVGITGTTEQYLIRASKYRRSK